MNIKTMIAGVSLIGLFAYGFFWAIQIAGGLA